jgi:hypothetical protein
VSLILDHMDKLRAGERVDAVCPWCTKLQRWWVPGNPEITAKESLVLDDNRGLACRVRGCGYTVVTKLNPTPPDILCAGCGETLQRIEDVAFHCPACNRMVRP